MIAGLQKMTLLDYPGKVACTVFLAGCNFRCPFCHNSQLLEGGVQEYMTMDAFLAFLEGRKGLLDGVCVTGGEPTLSPELPRLLQAIKTMGFAVKLDTNGSRPQILRALAEQGLIDHVAMDVKNSPARYSLIAGREVELSALEESLRFLLTSGISYELRTTLVEPLHTAESILQMGQWVAALAPDTLPEQWFLQSFVDRDTVLFAGLAAPSVETVENYAQMLAPYAQRVQIRNK